MDVEIVCKRAGKEDFEMLKLFAGTLVVLSLAAFGANAAETGTKTFPTSSVYPPRTPSAGMGIWASDALSAGV